MAHTSVCVYLCPIIVFLFPVILPQLFYHLHAYQEVVGKTKYCPCKLFERLYDIWNLKKKFWPTSLSTPSSPYKWYLNDRFLVLMPLLLDFRLLTAFLHILKYKHLSYNSKIMNGYSFLPLQVSNQCTCLQSCMVETVGVLIYPVFFSHPLSEFYSSCLFFLLMVHETPFLLQGFQRLRANYFFRVYIHIIW